MNAIEITGICKQFKGKKRSVVDAIKNLDLQIKRGEVFGFLGPNGAGKSTTIKIVMGLLQPTSGSASIMGINSSRTDSRLHVGFLPENPAFYDYLSAEEYVAFVGSQFRMETSLLKRRSDEVLKRLDLWEARKRPMRSYSKGMVQRVGLAQALVHDPDVYILDEPMSGLDPIGRALVKDIIIDLKKRGRCVFFSTHITDDVEKVCDRVGVIVKGQLRALDSVQNITHKGIEGYVVQTCANCGNHSGLNGFGIVRSGEVSVEYAVPLARFNEFTTLAGQNAIEITFIETRRKDLEAFFLEIVGKSGENLP